MKAAGGLPAGGVTVVLRQGTYVFDTLDHDTLRGVPGERVTLTLAESLDFRTLPIINQAEHVSFADIEVRGGVWDALHRPTLRAVRAAAGPPLRLVEDGQ